MSPRAFNLAAILLFLAALSLRLLTLHQLQHLGFIETNLSDALVYDQRSSGIVAGDLLGPPDFMHAPLYAYFLALIKFCGGTDPWTPRIVQCVLSALACPMLAHAGRRWFDAKTGLIAGALLALYPHAIYSDTIIQKTTLTTFLSVLGIWLIARAIDRRSILTAAALGLSLGLLTLNRQNAIVLLPLAASTLLFPFPRPHYDKPRSSTLAIVCLLAAVATLTPWVIRHKLVLNEFVLSGPNLGQNLEMGNNAQATGTYLPQSAPATPATASRPSGPAAPSRPSPALLSPRAKSLDYYLEKSLDWIKSSPLDFAHITRRKTLMFLGAHEWPDFEDFYLAKEHSSSLRALDTFLHFGVLLPLAAAGLALTWRQRRRWWPLIAWSLLIAASAIAFTIFARYRTPILPIVCMFAAAPFAQVFSKRPRAAALESSRSRAPTPAALTLAALALIATAYLCNLLAPDSRAPTIASYNNHAAALADTGRLQEAELEIAKSLTLDPNSPDAHAALASILLDAGRAADAVTHAAAAVKAAPNDHTLHRALGVALLQAGRPGDAEQAFRRAIELAPRDAKAYAQLGAAIAQSGGIEDAFVAINKAIEIDPKLPEARLNLGNAFMGINRYKDAQDAYFEALQLRQGWPDALHNLGVALTLQEKYSEAEGAFRFALQVAPHRTDTPEALVECLLRSNRKDDAIRFVREALTRTPDRTDLQALLNRLTQPQAAPNTR